MLYHIHDRGDQTPTYIPSGHVRKYCGETGKLHRFAPAGAHLLGLTSHGLCPLGPRVFSSAGVITAVFECAPPIAAESETGLHSPLEIKPGATQMPEVSPRPVVSPAPAATPHCTFAIGIGAPLAICLKIKRKCLSSQSMESTSPRPTCS